MLTYHKGTIMTWREIKGEEKWVSVPQAEGRVTISWLLPSQLFRVEEILPLVAQRKHSSKGMFPDLSKSSELHPTLHSITTVVSTHNQIRVARAPAFTFSPFLCSPLTSQQSCTNCHVWPLPALFSIVRYTKICCWQMIRIN